MAIVKVGSNEIGVTLGVVAVNGYGGQKDDEGVPLKVNPEWVRDPRAHYAKQLRVVEDASGRKDGWINDPKVAKWALKPFGVNTDLVAPRRAPYLELRDASGSSVWGDASVEKQIEMCEVLLACHAGYGGSTWGGDNDESPRAICPRHIEDLVRLCAGSPMLTRKRWCFDQGAAVLDGGENEAAFLRLMDAFATKNVVCMVEALPKDPRDLEWVGALARYAYLTGKGVMLKDETSLGHYIVPRGARLTVLFDGKVLREEAGDLTPLDVGRVVQWAAAYGIAGLGAKSIELLIAGPQHAKAVVAYAASVGVV